MKPIENTHLYQEIHQQADIIRRLIEQPQETISALANQIQERGIKQIYIAARGTSDNAARYAQYLFGAHNHMMVSLATPSLFSIYRQIPDLTGTLVLGISQSGKSPDIVNVLNEGKRHGALTAAITNTADSDLSQAADLVLSLNAGEELSLAATKTYTSQLTCLASLSVALNPTEALRHELNKLPDHVDRVFENETNLKQLVERYRYMTHCVVIGRGFNYATAFEFSLKIKELTYTIAESYSSADFLHGPVALVDRGFPVFVIAPSGLMIPEMRALVEKVNQRYAEVIMLSDDQDLLQMSPHSLELPSGIPEWLSPITAIMPGQMFAMYLAYTRAIDVDNPRGLNKVTETW